MEYETAYMREAGGNDHHHQPAQCIAIELEQLSYTHTQIHKHAYAHGPQIMCELNALHWKVQWKRNQK